MSENNENKKYEPFKIPDRSEVRNNGIVQSSSKTNAGGISSVLEEMFYEIEYGACPFPGVGKFVPKPQKIGEPEKKDEKRELFGRMREIARAYRSANDFYLKFFERNRNDSAAIFYRQGMFMKDFTDDFTGCAQFSQYFPYYQMMGYEQLRTYFTWRTEVGKGNVRDTSLSYAFLYIYELLSNIGVANPQDGLDKLVFFWKNFSLHNKAVDKYVLRWLKDYHIYYELPQSFKGFVEKNGLAGHYPEIAETEDSFDLFCSISKYDIKKSGFFTGDTRKMITDCFSYVLNKVREDFESAGIHFDDAFFRPTRRIASWQPFKDALFYNWLRQPDRRVVLSKNEIYICKNNEWTFSTVITSEKGRQFIGYVMKQTEAVLRNITKYKYKLTASTDMVHSETLRKLTKAGIFIDKIVPAAVAKFYREATKTVVAVDHAALERIRQEAQLTQEALIVEECAQRKSIPSPTAISSNDQNIFADSFDAEPVFSTDIWAKLKDALSDNEIRALGVVLQGGDIKAFAGACGVMPEVLIDGINEKATDYIGDNLTDEEFVLYGDYIEKIKELIK